MTRTQKRNKASLGRGAHVESSARLVGEVHVGEEAYVDSNAVLYGPLKVGRRTYIGPNCVIGFPASSELGQLIQSHRTEEKKLTLIGERCIVRCGTTIYSNVTVADDVAFGHNAMVRENVSIGKGTKLGTNVVVDGSTTIGNHASIQTGVYICTFSTVEDCVFLGPCCVFTNDKFVMQKQFKLIGPTVKKGASIGANALLFPGVMIGEGAVVGAQAVVNSEVASRTVVVGVPAKKIGDVPSDWSSSLLENLHVVRQNE
ncbi:MAG TPA: DapH/DapD/GlmU-related protein [Candidatus Acidoferrales bacterium]|nr:DapH/DapD/GlmU-related protein [Candidatus Acidoferrales bacterium]